MAYQQGSHGGGFVPSNVDTAQASAIAASKHGGDFVTSPSQSPRAQSAQFQSTYQQTQHPTVAPVSRTAAYSPPLRVNQSASSQPATYSTASAPRQQSVPSHGNMNGYARPAVAVPAANSLAEIRYNDDQLIRRPTELKGSKNRWQSNMMFRWVRKPHWVSRSGLMFDPTQNFHHRDAMDREYTGQKDSRYISPNDGKIKTLVVQCVDDILSGPGNGTWKRTYIRNVTQRAYKLAMWPFSHLDMREGSIETNEDWAFLIAKWIPTCVCMTIGIFFVTTPKRLPRPGYEAFNYRYWGYPKVARNVIEEDPSGRRNTLMPGMVHDPIAKRLLGPRYLCVLINPENKNICGWEVKECVQKYQAEKPPSYIFVAYTAEQFRTQEELTTLVRLAERAARDANVSGFWIGCSCMQQPQQLEDDVYRISDIIRGCAQVAIVVGPSTSNPSIVTPDHMLHQWGTRIWTFPEVLLAPAGKRIMVYCSKRGVAPFPIEKNQFAAKVWDDSEVSRQMIDHYEGNLILSRLELVILALECLQTRRTMQYLPGDYAYALMGLLRSRPIVDRSDSAFQAFARLSLANDSDRLLERLIATLPMHQSQPWYSMKDEYGVKLWDIEPSVGIAGIGQDDTVIIDGARGAAVRWKGFKRVAYARKFSFKRWAALWLLRISGVLWLVGVGLLFKGGSSPGPNPPKTAGAILLTFMSFVVFTTPHLVRVLFRGKLWDPQPWLFAFEGYLPIEDIEKQIFGARLNRLEWAPYSSPLSRHSRNEYGECCGRDPTTDSNIKAFVERAKKSRYGEQKIFTLVDTNTMTVTLFSAVNPPIGFLVVGSEGGMQRAVGVSLDWTTGTLYRETVLRMETPVLSRMDRVPRVKIGLRSPVGAVVPRRQN